MLVFYQKRSEFQSEDININCLVFSDFHLFQDFNDDECHHYMSLLNDLTGGVRIHVTLVLKDHTAVFVCFTQFSDCYTALCKLFSDPWVWFVFLTETNSFLKKLTCIVYKLAAGLILHSYHISLIRSAAHAHYCLLWDYEIFMLNEFTIQLYMKKLQFPTWEYLYMKVKS